MAESEKDVALALNDEQIMVFLCLVMPASE